PCGRSWCKRTLTEERLSDNMDGFWEKGQSPNCFGALDGKHCVMQDQPNAEGAWYKYKGTYSMVLLAICDSAYKFTSVNIGGHGRQHDAGIWRQSDLRDRLENGRLPLPPPRLPPGTQVATPPAIVGDGAFPLRPYLMTPFRQPQIVSGAEVIYNYRLSRARRTIENAFGILSARWRVLRQSFIASENTARAIIQACVVLHNHLVLNQENLPPHQHWYIPPNLDNIPGMAENRLPPVRGEAADQLDNAQGIRQELVDFFLGPGNAPCPWQWQHLG
ncbi:Protein ALP1-like, partial [Frankliniella fusca]